VATKRSRAATKKGTRRTARAGKSSKPTKGAPAPARTATKAAAATPSAPSKPAPAAGRRTVPVTRPASPGPTLLEQAERLRDEIQRTKLCHPDPWTYTAKARGWGQRAQALVDRIAGGGNGAADREALESLRAEVEADRDFQEARRLL
jgi:hypothetical protein